MHTVHGSKKHTKGASYCVAVFFERIGVAGRVSRISIVLLQGAQDAGIYLFHAWHFARKADVKHRCANGCKSDSIINIVPDHET